MLTSRENKTVEEKTNAIAILEKYFHSSSLKTIINNILSEESPPATVSVNSKIFSDSISRYVTDHQLKDILKSLLSKSSLTARESLFLALCYKNLKEATHLLEAAARELSYAKFLLGELYNNAQYKNAALREKDPIAWSNAHHYFRFEEHSAAICVFIIPEGARPPDEDIEYFCVRDFYLTAMKFGDTFYSAFYYTGWYGYGVYPYAQQAAEAGNKVAVRYLRDQNWKGAELSSAPLETRMNNAIDAVIFSRCFHNETILDSLVNKFEKCLTSTTFIYHAALSCCVSKPSQEMYHEIRNIFLKMIQSPADQQIIYRLMREDVFFQHKLIDLEASIKHIIKDDEISNEFFSGYIYHELQKTEVSACVQAITGFRDEMKILTDFFKPNPETTKKEEKTSAFTLSSSSL